MLPSNEMEKTATSDDYNSNTTQEGMQEIKNNPQVYTTQEGIGEIKNNPLVYTTQEGMQEFKNIPQV